MLPVFMEHPVYCLYLWCFLLRDRHYWMIIQGRFLPLWKGVGREDEDMGGF